MTVFKLQIGLTDVEESENFVYDDIDTTLDRPTIKRVRYNILKQSDEIEKATLEWKLNVDLPAVQSTIKYWEHTIRRPHLSMIQITSESNRFLPTHSNFEINIDFVNLLPLSINPEDYTDEDFENTCYPHNRRFGDLELGYHAAYNVAGYSYEETSEYAIFNDTLEYYNPEARPVAIPYFFIDFFLSKPAIKASKLDSRTLKFINDHQEEFMNLGIDKDTFLKTYGRFTAGTLLTEPLEAYTNIKDYPRICRTSIVKED